MGLRLLALNWRCFRHPQAGGGETNLFEQARRWAAAGHTVTVVCADPGRRHAPQRDEVHQGVQIRRMGGRLGVYPLAALYLLRHGGRFERILDVSNGVPFFSPLLTRTPSVLLVHHVHDRQWYSEFPRPVAEVGRFLERRVVPALYRRRPVIVVSPTTRDGLRALGFPADHISVVYNGVDLPELPAELPAPDGRRVLYLGRLKRYKRLDKLVRAVAALRGEVPDIQLDIAGDGDARPEIEALVRELGMEARVRVHGFVSEAEKGELLRRAAVFAQPSMHEGWGISVIEANAWGCPAVAYDVPGLSVAIRDGETGWLAADDAAFQGALRQALQDPAERARRAGAARRWAANFDWDSAAHQTLTILGRADRIAAQPTSAAPGGR